MKCILTLALSFLSLTSFCQSKVDTIYVDDYFQEVIKDIATYYRCRVQNQGTKLFTVEDYTMDNALFQKSSYKDIDLKNAQGLSIIYYPNSQVKKETYFENNIVVRERYYNKYGKDSIRNKGASKQILEVVETMPEYPGGVEAMVKFLDDNIKYPEDAKKGKIFGRVYITFIVTAKGILTDIKLVHGIGGGCDEEALKAVHMMPIWKPGTMNGKPVSNYVAVPVFFRLGK
jgi:TonB family protein